jgi:hydrogenase maturation protease
VKSEIRDPRSEGSPKARSPNPKAARKTTSKTLLLGLGNDILTDDAIGMRVAAALRERFTDHSELVITETAEMGLSLLDFIAGFDTLMLVDAIQTHKAAPGFVHEIEGDDLQTLPVISPHFLGVGEALALGRRLGLPVPGKMIIFAIEVKDPFTVSTRLTEALEGALPGIVERVAKSVRTYLTAGQSKSQPASP